MVMRTGGTATARHHPQKVTVCTQSFPFSTQAATHSKQRAGPREGETQDGEGLVTGVAAMENSPGKVPPSKHHGL